MGIEFSRRFDFSNFFPTASQDLGIIYEIDLERRSSGGNPRYND
jgi:hypothetical protein